MKKLTLIFLGLFVILLQSCSKESNPVNNNDTNIGADSYFPLINGSTWVYTSNAVGQFTNQVVGDSVIAGVTYKKIGAKNSSSSIMSYSHVRGVGSGVNIPKADPNGVVRDVVWLKDGVRVGDTWTYKSNDNRAESFYEYTCTQAGIQKTVRSKTYSDVICIQSVIGFNISGNRIIAGNLTTYYAKGVGMIEQLTSSASGTSDVIQLISYTKN